MFRPLLAIALGCSVLCGCGGAGSAPALPPQPGAALGPSSQSPTVAVPPVTLWVSDPDGGAAGLGSIYAFTISPGAKTVTLVPNSAFVDTLPNVNGQPAGLNAPQQIRFDRSGRLWVVAQLSDLLAAFTIGKPGTAPVLDVPTAVAIPPPAGQTFGYSPQFLAYDPVANTLWTSDGNSYPHEQAFSIGSAGTVPLKTVFRGSVPFLYAISFDRKGVMWAVNYGDIFALSVSEATATYVPGSYLTTNCGAPVFDAANDLWCVDAPGGSGSQTNPKIWEYQNPGASGKAPKLARDFVPPGPIKGDNTRFLTPIGFDAKGNLWLLADDLNSRGESHNDYSILAYAVSPKPALIVDLRLPRPSDVYAGAALAP